MKLKAIPIAVTLSIIILGIITYFYDSYLRKNKTKLASQVVKLDITNAVEILTKLTSTKPLTTNRKFTIIWSDSAIESVYKNEESISAMVKFSPHHRRERQYRTIQLEYPELLNMDKCILVTHFLVEPQLDIPGHRGSRVQFELQDIYGKIMRGPRLPIAPQNKPTIVFIRPTVNEPIPSGLCQPGFDLRRVRRISVRFILGKDKKQTKTIRGKISFGEIWHISEIELINKFMPIPQQQRITRDDFIWTKPLAILPESEFFQGINYPWNNYGWDFGKNPYNANYERMGWSAHTEKIRNEFFLIKARGSQAVRLFVFCDMRTGIKRNSDGMLHIDEYVLDDLETILCAAKEAELKLILVLFDYLIANTPISEYSSQNQGRPELVFFETRYMFLENVIVPFLRELEQLNQKYQRPILALELMNEPENAPILMFPGYFKSLKNWLTDLRVIARHETSLPITLGARSLLDMQIWWNGLGLDILQFHFYPELDYDIQPNPLEVKREKISSPRPILCGELGLDHNYTETLQCLQENGYAGALTWSWQARDGFNIDTK